MASLQCRTPARRPWREPRRGPGQLVHRETVTATADWGKGLERLVLVHPAVVRIAVALQAASGREASDLLETLRFLMATTRLEPGCQGCVAWGDTDCRVHYAERWATEAAVRRRVRSPGFTSVLALMERASEPPDVQFDFVSRTRGLDFVAEVRGEPVYAFPTGRTNNHES